MPTNIGGIRVPEGNGALENCHHFAIAILKASGALGANVEDNPNSVNAQQLLFPKGEAGYTAARVNGNLTVQPGAIIGFWDAGVLMHTMYAESQTTWWGANNTSTFGTAGGRFKFDNMGSHERWIGATNQWRGSYATNTLIWRLIPR